MVFLSSNTIAQTKQYYSSSSPTRKERSIIKNADSIWIYRIFEMQKDTTPSVPGLPNAIQSVPMPKGYKPQYKSIIRTSKKGIALYKKNASIVSNESYFRKMTVYEEQSLKPFLLAKDSTNKVREANCKFAPGAGIKFFKGKKEFIVLLCFNCKVWAFEDENGMKYMRFSKQTEKELIEYAKKLFPNDIDFQKL